MRLAPPPRVYHGTAAAFDRIEPRPGKVGPGIYFAEDMRVALDYAGASSAARVIVAELAIENPYFIRDGERFDPQEVRSRGHDGIFYEETLDGGDGRCWVAFRSDQVRVREVLILARPPERMRA